MAASSAIQGKGNIAAVKADAFADNVTKLMRQLECLHAMCVCNKRRLKHVNSQCYSLLRPWPEKKKDKDNENQQNDKAGDGHEIITKVEEMKIGEVQKVLSKAQRTRQVQNKVDEQRLRIESKYSKDINDIRKSVKSASSDSTIRDKQEQTVSSVSLGQGKNLRGQQEVEVPSRQHSAKSSSLISRNDGVITNSRLNHLLSNSEVGKKSAGSKKQVSDKSLPAHMKAPFKTIDERRKPSQTRGQKPGLGSSVTKGKGPQNSKTENRALTGVSDMSKSVAQNLQQEKKLDNQKDVTDEAKADIEEVSVSAQHAISANQGSPSHQDLSLAGSVPSSQSGAVQNTSSGNGEKKAGFSLIKNGGSLQVPGRLRRLLTSNQKLRTQLQTAAITSRVTSLEAAPSAEQFINKLQHHIKVSNPIGSKVEDLQHSYRQALLQLKQLPEEYMSGGDALAKLQWCRNRLEELMGQHRLLEVQYHALLHKVGHGQRHQYTQEKNQCASVHQQILQQRPHSNCSHWYPVVGLPQNYESIAYSQLKDLLRYTQLLFQAQMLALEVDLLKKLEETLLPVIRNPRQYDRGKWLQLLRLSYSLLATRGRTMPSLLCDVGEDDSTEDQSSSDFTSPHEDTAVT